MRYDIADNCTPLYSASYADTIAIRFNLKCSSSFDHSRRPLSLSIIPSFKPLSFYISGYS